MKKIFLFAIMLCCNLVFSQSAQSTYKKLKNNQLKSVFHAVGEEPWWDLYLLNGSAIYADEGNSTYINLKYDNSFDKTKKSQQIKFITPSNKAFTIRILKQKDEGKNKYNYTVEFGNEGTLPAGILYEHGAFLVGEGYLGR
jgi:hypothetical protein